MNVPFLVAALLAFVGAAIHGGLGEKLVVGRLRTATLDRTRFGGPSMTKLMIRVTWHIVTATFVVLGASLVACVPDASSRACGGIGTVTSVSFAAFGVVAFAIALSTQRFDPRLVIRHPGPLVFILVAILAGWGGTRY